MSVQAISWAYRMDPPNSGAKFLLVTLANAADPHGVTYIGRERLARDCGCAPETVSANLGKLTEVGLIDRVQRRRANRSRTSDYIVLAPRMADRGEMSDAPDEEFPEAVIDLAKRVKERSPADSSGEDPSAPQVAFSGGPDPSGEPSASSGGKRASALKINGKPVKSETWRRTLAALAAFNAATRKSQLAVTGTGDPSEAAKRIYGRLAAWPDLNEEQVVEVIDRTLASRWWGDGTPSVGVIFGPKVFEENLSRAPQTGNVHQLRPRSGGRADRIAANIAEAERMQAELKAQGL